MLVAVRWGRAGVFHLGPRCSAAIDCSDHEWKSLDVQTYKYGRLTPNELNLHFYRYLMPENDREECPELRNIRFRSGHSRNNANMTEPDEIAAVEAILDNESSERKPQPWSRLDRAVRIKKLMAYADRLIAEDKLDDNQSTSLKESLKLGAQRRRLERARDVDYDQSTGLVKAVPNLVYNQGARRYTLKRSDKRPSTLKSLAPAKRERGRGRGKAKRGKDVREKSASTGD